MTQEEKQIIEEILEKFIFTIRRGELSSVHFLVFSYYTIDIQDTFQPKKDFESVKYQIRKKILTQRNSYWKLNETKAKFVENFAIYHEKEFDTFKDFVENLWTCDLQSKLRKFEEEEKIENNKQNQYLKSILKDKYELYHDVVEMIINDDIVYACKSDKIKIFIDLNLDVDTITLIMGMKEKWIVQRGYVDKYKKEKEQAIKERKASRYDTISVIENVKTQLKNRLK